MGDIDDDIFVHSCSDGVKMTRDPESRATDSHTVAGTEPVHQATSTQPPHMAVSPHEVSPPRQSGQRDRKEVAH